MRLSGFTLSLLGLLAFVSGVIIHALTAWVACFDTCPQDLSGTMIRWFLGWVGPGFVLSWLAWALALPGQAHTGRWGQFAFVLGVVLLSGVGMLAFLLLGSQAGVIPSQEDQLPAWTSLLWRGFLPFAIVFPLGAFGVHYVFSRTQRQRPI